MKVSTLSILWAKLGLETDAYPSRAHPVICHLLDVQSVALELYDRSVGSGLQHWMAQVIALPTDEASGWFSLRVAAHDLGKISPDFQMKAAKHNAALIPKLEAHGFSHAIGSHSSSIPHGQITAVTLPELLVNQLGMPRPLAESRRQRRTTLLRTAARDTAERHQFRGIRQPKVGRNKLCAVPASTQSFRNSAQLVPAYETGHWE